MPIAVKPRPAVGATLLGLLLAIGLASVSTASAAIRCKGHTALGKAGRGFAHPIDYRFACDGPILGYMLISDQKLDAFSVAVAAHDPESEAIVDGDGFGCGGEMPGRGISCTSASYTPNAVVEGMYSVAGRKPCVEPRSHAQLIVVAGQFDAVTGLPAGGSLGSTAGPFDLGRPQGCPSSSILGGLLAEITLAREALRHS